MYGMCPYIFLALGRKVLSMNVVQHLRKKEIDVDVIVI